MPWLGSLMEELRRREAAARAGADRLRSRIEELAEELARAEEQVSRLVIAREEVTRLLEGPAVADPPAGQQAGGFAGEPRQASPAGAVTVPPWQDGAEASALPRAYRTCWKWRPTRGARRPVHTAGSLRENRETRTVTGSSS
jgi:hypothetical protein